MTQPATQKGRTAEAVVADLVEAVEDLLADYGPYERARARESASNAMRFLQNTTPRRSTLVKKTWKDDGTAETIPLDVAVRQIKNASGSSWVAETLRNGQPVETYFCRYEIVRE